MTGKQAKLLLPGTVVRWEDKDTVLGTVRGVHPHDGLYIDWSDGQRGWIGFDRVEKLHLWN